MPSAETRERAASTSTTSLKRERSTRGRACRSRSRNRFDVLFARPIPPGPPAASSARSRASLLSWLFTGVEESAAHRIVLADVALAHHDLEEVRLAVGGAEHLGARPEVSPPDSAEPLVELPGIELVHPLPITVEATRPVVEGERVVAPQVFDVHDLEPAALDLGTRFPDLFGGGVDAGAERAVLLPGVEEQVAPAAADVGEGVASLEQDLAAHVIHLGDLRFLERLGAVGEPGAGVGHAHFVEPFPVEVLSRPVVKARVRLRLRDRRVAVSEFVPPVAHLGEESRLAVETGVHARAEGVREAALDIDIAVEVGLEKADVAEQQHAPRGAAVADEDGDVGCALVVLPGTLGEDDAETDLGLRADLLHRLLELRVHDPSRADVLSREERS